MALLRLTCAFFALCTSICFSQTDKALHFGAGAVISGLTYEVVYQKTGNKNKALLWGLASGIAAGIAKEVYDPVFDKKDLIATTAGSFTATVTINIFEKKTKKKGAD